jgi:hypothetical protein
MLPIKARFERVIAGSREDSKPDFHGMGDFPWPG